MQHSRFKLHKWCQPPIPNLGHQKTPTDITLQVSSKENFTYNSYLFATLWSNAPLQLHTAGMMMMMSNVDIYLQEDLNPLLTLGCKCNTPSFKCTNDVNPRSPTTSKNSFKILQTPQNCLATLVRLLWNSKFLTSCRIPSNPSTQKTREAIQQSNMWKVVDLHFVIDKLKLQQDKKRSLLTL